MVFGVLCSDCFLTAQRAVRLAQSCDLFPDCLRECRAAVTKDFKLSSSREIVVFSLKMDQLVLLRTSRPGLHCSSETVYGRINRGLKFGKLSVLIEDNDSGDRDMTNRVSREFYAHTFITTAALSDNGVAAAEKQFHNGLCC